MKFIVRMKHSSVHPEKWTQKTVKARSKKQAAYQAVRSRYKFLTDDNHTWEWDAKGQFLTICKNENSPSCIGAPGWYPDGSGAYWVGSHIRVKAAP